MESSPVLPNSSGDLACSLSGNLGHPQSYTALYKSLKYSTSTLAVTMQKYSLNSLLLFLPQNLISCTQPSMGIMCTFSTERLQWSTAIWARYEQSKCAVLGHCLSQTDAVSKKRPKSPQFHSFLTQMAQVALPAHAITVRHIRIKLNFQQSGFTGSVCLM